jgi:predicted nucleotidyltransferase
MFFTMQLLCRSDEHVSGALMDHAHAITSLIPGARGAVLDVLTRVQRGMTIRQIADRAGVSHPQAARHIRDLERLGIVSREHVGRSHRITLTETLTSALLRRLAGLREEAIREMRSAAARIDPRPLAMVIFGSFARGDDDADSDIDVLVIVEDGMTEGASDPTLSAWCRHIAGLTGNPVAEVVVTLRDFHLMDQGLRDSIARDRIMIVGDALPDVPALRVVAEEGSPYGA